MGLRVWLPLNGNLDNQGLENISGTNVSATVNTAGKIGSCYSFNGTSSRIGFPAKVWKYPISVCAWIKCNNATDSNTEYIVSYNTATGGTAGHNIGFGLYTGKISIWHGGSVNSYATALTSNVWYHIAAVVTSSSYTLYLNGNEIVSGSTAQSDVSSQFLTLGARSSDAGGGATGALYFFNGYMNDFRLYDHALSVKEVEELARGLVLHYKLDDPLMESTTNYAPSPYKTSYTSYSPGWDTSKHPNAVTVNGWGGGYNSGVPSPTTGYHAMWNIINDIPTIVFQDHNSEISQTHRWLGISSSALSSTFVSNTPAGTKYCISFDMKTIDTLGGQVNVGVYYKTTSSSSNNFYDGNKTSTANTQLNIWERKTLTFTRSSAFDGNTQSQTIYVYGHYGAEATVYVRNIQLEIKDHSTPYDVATRTASRVVDCSGYKRHGTILNNLVNNTSSARYTASTKFNGTNAKIKLPTMTYSNFGNSYTFSWWQYNTSTGNMPWGFSDGNRLNVYHASALCWNTGDGSANPFKDGSTTITSTTLQNAWHHMCVTGDGTDAKIYIDGVYRGKATTYKGLTGIQIYMSGWDTGTNYTFNNSSLSDFRIYATTLTAKQVQELYNESAAIDRNANYYTREAIEQ